MVISKATCFGIRLILKSCNLRVVSKCKSCQSFKLTTASKRLPNSADSAHSEVELAASSVQSASFDPGFDKKLGQALKNTCTMGRRKRKPNNPNVNHPKKMQKFQQDKHYEDIEQYIENGKKFQQDKHYEDIEQYIENGMRKIKPYIFTFETHAKGRWIGKKLMDVFKKEFRMETPLYYKTAIEGGLIRLNGKTVKPDRVIRSQDFLQSRVHRHEPPVSGEPLEIIAETDNFIVINKPSSIPIYPAGKYRHNTIVYLMAKEHGLKGLHTFYRLDRLTSGVFIFARSVEVTKRIDSQVRGRELHKVYLCKVNGEFPSEPIECNEPIFTVSFKIGVCRVSPEGKPSKTLFERVSYDGDTSIIKCMPHTGRMHQIRVHLQYLGFPILNDPLYTGPVWGPDQGKGGNIPYDNDDEFIKELTRVHNKEQMENQIKADCDMLVSKLDDDVMSRNKDTHSNTTQQSMDSDHGNQVSTTTEPICSTSRNTDSSNGEDTPGSTTQQTMDSDSSNHVLTTTTEPICGTSRNTGSSKREEFSVDMDSSNEGTTERTSTKNDDISSVSIATKEDVGAKLSATSSIGRVAESSADCTKEVKTSDVLDIQRSIISQPSEERTPNMMESSDIQQTCTKVDAQNTDNVPLRTETNESNLLENAVSCTQNSADVRTASETEKRGIAQGKDPATNVSLDTKTDEKGNNAVADTSTKTLNSEKTAVATSGSEVKGESSQSSTSGGSTTEDAAVNKLVMELCRECRHPLPDPEPESMVMYLHALSYKGPDFEFSTPLPKWAAEHMERTGSEMP